jgi:hypothetical protein
MKVSFGQREPQKRESCQNEGLIRTGQASKETKLFKKNPREKSSPGSSCISTSVLILNYQG